MKRRRQGTVVISLLIVVAFPSAPVGTAAPAPREEQEAPRRYTNLQVLPENITRDDLVRTMKAITKSLGAKCKSCHRTETRDYASDAIKRKVTARTMMRMVERINRELFTGGDTAKVTCFMCHRGQLKPQPHPRP